MKLPFLELPFDETLVKPSMFIELNETDFSNPIILDGIELHNQLIAKTLLFDAVVNTHIRLSKHEITTRDNKTISYYALTPDNVINNRLCFYTHGGGFLTNTEESCIKIANKIATDLSCVVVIADYRCITTHPYPYAINDCLDVFNSIANIYSLDNYFIYGDSAGGCLAIQVNCLLKKTNYPRPKATILTYPVTDNSEDDLSMAQYYDGCWSKNSNHIMWDLLTKHNTLIDEYTIPYNIKDLTNFGPCWIDTCQYDCLKDQGYRFAYKLSKDNLVLYREIKGSYHAYDCQMESSLVQSIYQQRFNFLRQYLK